MEKKIIGILIAMLLFSSILLVGCNDDDKFARDRIMELTEVEIPEEALLVYHHFDNVFVNGRRAQYTVFEFAESPTDFLKEFDFQEGRSSENERSFLLGFGFLTIKAEDIPEKYTINFERQHLWICTQNVYFFYFPDQLMLVIYVDGS